jgi:hypothetical protein
VATGKVVSRVLLPRDELLRVEELAVRACAHLIDDRGLKVDKNGPRHMLARAGLAEERVERIMCNANRGITADHNETTVLKKDIKNSSQVCYLH